MCFLVNLTRLYQAKLCNWSALQCYFLLSARCYPLGIPLAMMSVRICLHFGLKDSILSISIRVLWRLLRDVFNSFQGLRNNLRNFSLWNQACIHLRVWLVAFMFRLRRNEVKHAKKVIDIIISFICGVLTFNKLHWSCVFYTRRLHNHGDADNFFGNLLHHLGGSLPGLFDGGLCDHFHHVSSLLAGVGQGCGWFGCHDLPWALQRPYQGSRTHCQNFLRLDRYQHIPGSVSLQFILLICPVLNVSFKWIVSFIWFNSRSPAV